MANPLNLFGGPKGIRTPVTDVRGQCPRPLDDGTIFLIQFQISNFESIPLPAGREELSSVQKPGHPLCLVQINAQPIKNQAIFH
jgi:hypothetical protein